jgi:hypothetical protein
VSTDRRKLEFKEIAEEETGLVNLNGRLGVFGVRLGQCIVIVAMIVTAEALVADVAEDKESRPSHCNAAFTCQIQNVVSEDGRDKDESDSDEPVSKNAKIAMRPTAKAKRDHACREDKPEQHCVEASIAE